MPSIKGGAPEIRRDINMLNDKKMIFSGIQPSGVLTIGNYLGALKNWVALQDDYDCLYCIVDLHAITVRQEPAELRRRTLEALALYLACGIDPAKSTLFVQSHVPAHTQLSWILGCSTMFGELSRMTQFKDKAAKHSDNINAGLFTYPVLMAADILLYQADLVPVGHDQKQHLEITRDVAERFNHVYGETFTVPEPYILKTGMRIMSLADPTKKMSKSDENPNGYVAIIESRDETIRKIKRAVTDSDTCVRFADGKDGINNLMSIYSAFTGKTLEQIEAEFEGRGYGDFKAAVGETCADALQPIRDEFGKIVKDKAYLESIMRSGAERACGLARRTLSKVDRKVGFYPSPKDSGTQDLSPRAEGGPGPQ